MNQRIGLLIVYLAAHSPDIDINDVGHRIEMNIPYMLEKHGARYDLAFIADQIFGRSVISRPKAIRRSGRASRSRPAATGDAVPNADPSH
jgi:hypothetical protein